MKYYNFETMFISLAIEIGDFLKDNNIYFEISKNGQYYHFEILTDATGAEYINNFIDSVTIWSRGVAV
jgi:hypothetical protein